MAGNGIFDEDDWGDTEDFFQQIDQFVLQQSKPGQVTGRQSASPRQLAANQRAPLVNGRYGQAQLQLSQPQNTHEQAQNGAQNGDSRADVWPAYQAPSHVPGAYTGTGPFASQKAHEGAGQNGRGSSVQQRSDLPAPGPQPQSNTQWQHSAAPQPLGSGLMPRHAQASVRSNVASTLQPPAPARPQSLLDAQMAGLDAHPELNLEAMLRRLQQEKDDLQRQMSDKEGQTKVLRSKVEQVEREKRELQMRISQSSQGGMAVFQAQELQRQLDIARQNLAHKEQEADEMLRRNRDRDERLKVLQAEAANFSAETKRLEQQRAQLEAELAEAHRERRKRSAAAESSGANMPSPAYRKSLSPRNWQPVSSQGFGQQPRKQHSTPQRRLKSSSVHHTGPAASSVPGCEAAEASAREAAAGSFVEHPASVLPWDRPTWQSGSSTRHPGNCQNLWQALSIRSAASLARLMTPMPVTEGAAGLGDAAAALKSLHQTLYVMSWGSCSDGISLLLDICQILVAGTGSAYPRQVLPALLDILLSLLQCCQLAQCTAIASCASSDEGVSKAAQLATGGVGASGRVHFENGTAASTAEQANAQTVEVDVRTPTVLELTGLSSIASATESIRALAPIDDKNGRGLLSLILGLWDCMPDSAMHNALCVLAALVAAVPAERRYILAPIATSGLLERSQSDQLLFLDILYLLLESSDVCDLLEGALASVPDDTQHGSQQEPDREGRQAQRDVARWTGAWSIFRALNACLSLNGCVYASIGGLSGCGPSVAPEVPRRAMAVLALLLESGRSGLLLPLFSEELDSPSCVQQLVILADEACHHPSWSGMGLQPPASKKEAGTWHERLRLTQEALTLLRGLSVQPQVKDVVLEDHISSAARHVVRWRPLQRDTKGLADALLLAPWAHAIGASSVIRSIKEKAGIGCLSMTNVEDAVHLAKGLLRRVHNGIPQLTES